MIDWEPTGSKKKKKKKQTSVMGCFLACFGPSNDKRRGKQRRKVQVQPGEQVSLDLCSLIQAPNFNLVLVSGENSEKLGDSTVGSNCVSFSWEF